MPSIDPIDKKDDLHFKCSQELSCYNMCCKGMNQALTGYDILKMARAKNLTTSEFLKKYTFSYTGKQTGMPVYSLFQQPDKDNQCIFMTEKGCSIYEARPLSCRLYPIARGVGFNPKTEKITEQFAVINEGFCLGFGCGELSNVDDWMKTQDIDEYIKASDLFMIFISKLAQKKIKPDSADKKKIKTACYDLDLFLEKISSGEIILKEDIQPEELRNNDEALFQAGIKWIENELIKS